MNLDLDRILTKNAEYNIWEKALENEIKNKKAALVQENERYFPIDEFKKLDYESAKQIYKEIEWNVSSEFRKTIEVALQEIKENKYTILKLAHYYPCINDFNYLSDTQKHSLDDLLYRLGKSYIHTGSTSWYKLKLTKENEEKVLEDLYKAGVIEKAYRLVCKDCGNYSRVISEEQYLNNKKMYEIFDKIRLNTETPEEIDWAEKFQEDGERVWGVECIESDDCDYYEIESFEELENSSRLIYRGKGNPDLTYARL